MTNNKLYLYLSLGLCIITSACSTQPSKITDTPAWSGRMQGFAQHLYILFPLISDPASFNDPKNHAQIETSLSFLAHSSHDMDMQVLKDKAQAIDPAVAVLANNFKIELSVAKEAFDQGETNYARSAASTALQLCIECHSQKPDPQGRKAIFDPEALMAMQPLYRADWLAATRNFDDALKTYMSVLTDKEFAKEKPKEWGKAAVRAVDISVSVKNDPGESAKLVALILNSENAPHFIIARAQTWQKQIDAWKKEKTLAKPKKDKLEAAKILMRGAAYDPVTDAKYDYIYLLRASALLHTFLHETGDPQKSARAYLLLGQCYESLPDPGQVGLSKNYFKACIVADPHSDVAGRCYDNYEDLVYRDSLGGTVGLPISATANLNYYKSLALASKAKP